ncbi:MAG: FAD-dependent oxidoreductase [Pseudomonadota bacterium]
MKKTAVIIGSGISGICLAEILSRNNYKIILLEKEERLGGEASLATQNWYHTGFLYAPLPNKSTLLSCHRAISSLSKVYGNIFPKKKTKHKLFKKWNTVFSKSRGLVYG